MEEAKKQLTWVHEPDARWDEDKRRIFSAIDELIFAWPDSPEGSALAGSWWRLELDGAAVGYGWMSLVWGEAEIQGVIDPIARTLGLGEEMLHQLILEAGDRGATRVFTTLREEHPRRERVAQWLASRGFEERGGRLVFGRAEAAEERQAA